MWIKIAIGELGPLTVVVWRVFFAVAGLIGVILWKRPARPSRKMVVAFCVLGVFNTAIPLAMVAWSEEYIPTGLASILNSTVPLFTMVIAPLFIAEERITPARILGLLVGFGGVIVLMSNQLNSGTGEFLMGELAMVAASLLYAGSAVFARLTLRGVAAESQALGQMVSAGFLIFPAALAFEAPFTVPAQAGTWVAVAWLGLIGSCLALVLYFSLLSSVGPTRTTLVSYIFPLVGVVLGVVFLNEVMDWRLLVGGLAIISGVAIVNRR
jgi:drug/metabolite transporter (DMT)-like permease